MATRLLVVAAALGLAVGSVAVTQISDDSRQTAPEELVTVSEPADTGPSETPASPAPSRDGRDASERMTTWPAGDLTLAELAVPGSDPYRNAVQSVDGEFDACLPTGEIDWDDVDALAFAWCMRDVMLEATVTHGPSVTFDAIAQVIERNPPLETLCHSGAHEAGSLSYEMFGAVSDTMVLANTTCGFGYTHGVLDMWGLSSPTDDEFAAVSDTCDQDVWGDNKGTCYDAVGHAAWNSSQDLDTAVGICGSLPRPSARSACSEGILMQMFDPAYLNPTYTLDEAPGKLPALCADWPDDTLPLDAEEGPRDACYQGAAYLLMLPVTNVHARTGQSVEERLDEVVEHIAEVAETCFAFDEPGPRLCAGALGTHLAGPLSRFDPEIATALCEGTRPYQDACNEHASAVARFRQTVNPDGTTRPGGDDEDDSGSSDSE